MKAKAILLISTISLVCLLTFQGIWLYHIFQSNLEGTQDILNLTFPRAVDKELDYRLLKSDTKAKEFRKTTNDSTITMIEFDPKRVEQDGAASLMYELNQQSLALDFPFNLATLDSIYSSLLIKEGLHVKYLLTYQDSTKIIETAGLKIDKGFKTSTIPIVNGTSVYATVRISPQTVFRNLLEMLIASALMLIILIGILVYATQYTFNQHRLNQLRDNFTHSLTHDMKTPLGTIYMIISQLKNGDLENNPQLKQKFCDIANGEILNLKAIIDQILTLAYAEKNKLILNKKAVDLQVMVQHLVDRFLAKGGKSIEFDTQVELSDAVVFADPLYLENAVSNLIDNAIKYSKENVRIQINCFSNHKMVFIHVKDNGIGISEKNKERIFERFERGAAINNKKASGFGLGLNYVKTVVEAHGGTIALSSKEGEGSEFVIAIPILITPIKEEMCDKYSKEAI